jgi:hypothetical protein
VYGFLAEEPDLTILEQQIVSDTALIVYGYPHIRKELRSIPKKSELSRRARMMLLILYDSITKGRVLDHSLEFENLAKEYHAAYKKRGGTYSWDTNIRIDFMLVACASVHNLDVVFSADKKTLISRPALEAYESVNSRENLKTPIFLGYECLIERLRNHSSL